MTPSTFAGEDKWRARKYGIANVALSLATTLFMVRISYAQRNFQTALSGKDEGKALDTRALPVYGYRCCIQFIDIFSLTLELPWSNFQLE